MRISEIFYSIQGEGILTGVPSVFVRTGVCNLRCSWCDTPYTSWRSEYQDMGLTEIVSNVHRHGCSYVVITGGEPMLESEIVGLTQQLRAIDHHITIETNGTVFKPVACDLMSISPKLTNSTPREREGGDWAEQHDRLRYQPALLRDLITQYAYQLKFVVSSDDDIAEVRSIVGQIGASQDRVLLMPEGTQSEILQERSQWLAERCKELKFRFCPRLHIAIWGDQRGV
jgi:7-carboxy-7-deazaguanine synthase